MSKDTTKNVKLFSEDCIKLLALLEDYFGEDLKLQNGVDVLFVGVQFLKGLGVEDHSMYRIFSEQLNMGVFE